MPPKPLVLFAPIYEEIIFRGLILGALLTQLSKRQAILYSSLLFGAWHLKNIFFLDLDLLTYQMLYTTLFVRLDHP